MVQNQQTGQTNNLQALTLNNWQWNRVVTEKHAEDVNRGIMRRQFSH